MDKRKAATILKQIGGNRFIAMTGAKDLGSTNKSLQFKIGRNSKGINHVRIAHNAKDLYDISLWSAFFICYLYKYDILLYIFNTKKSYYYLSYNKMESKCCNCQKKNVLKTRKKFECVELSFLCTKI